ncbi:hypothetical protein HaLaN_27736, partial [Haematococcus lacustris]
MRAKSGLQRPMPLPLGGMIMATQLESNFSHTFSFTSRRYTRAGGYPSYRATCATHNSVAKRASAARLAWGKTA